MITEQLVKNFFTLTGPSGTPATITADQNDYAPAGIQAAGFLRISSDATRTITGLVAPTGNTPKRLTIVNVGAFDIILSDQDTASAAANRFLIELNTTLAPNASVTLQYDPVSLRWRNVSTRVVPQTRNYIINGNFDIWQRGISRLNNLASSQYLADRWIQTVGGAATSEVTVSQDSDVPAGVNANFSHKCVVTTAQGVLAAGDFANINYRMEGNDFMGLYNRIFTLSFWVKSSITGTFGVSLRNSASDRSFVKNITVDLANTWEKKTLTFTHDPTGVWLFTSGVGLRLSIALAAGASKQTTENTWAAGDFIATSAQTNWTATGANTFFLAQVQLERGSAATEYEFVNFNDTLSRCKRYYEKSVALTNYSFIGAGSMTGATAGTVTDLSVLTKFTVEKRSTPTGTVFAVTSGTSGAVRNFTTPGDVTAVSLEIGVFGFRVFKTSAFTIGSWYGYNWTADAEL